MLFRSIPKRLVWKHNGNSLSFREVLSFDLGFALSTRTYEEKGVLIFENTPSEIRDVAIEMAERISNVWRTEEEDIELQAAFWRLFPSNAVDPVNGAPLHGAIRARIGAKFLREHREWLH